MSLIVNASRVYQHIPFNGKKKATYSQFEIPSISAITRASLVESNICRFTYDKHSLPPEEKYALQYEIITILTDIFTQEGSLDNSMITFPAAIQGQRYIDVEMDGVPPDQWNAELQWTLESGVDMAYYTKGINIAEHLVTISVYDVTTEKDIYAVCRAVAGTIQHARIIDIFQERMKHPKTSGTRFCGSMHFIVELLDYLTINDEDDLEELIERVYDKSTNTYKTTKWAVQAAIDPSDHLAYQKGWINIGADRELQLIYKGRRQWCSICRAGASNFHEMKDCDEYRCHDCGQQGHYKLDPICEGVIDTDSDSEM